MAERAIVHWLDRAKPPFISFRAQLEPFYRKLARKLAISLYHPIYKGFEHIPAEGGILIVSNHVSYMDGLIIAAGCGRPVRFIIDDEIYGWPGVHHLMRHNRAIPIAATRASVTKALNEISEGLRAGDAICIFPEGQLTSTGSLGRFKPGIEWILRRDSVPIYPVALVGLWGSIFSRKHPLLLRWLSVSLHRKVVAVCGKPIPSEIASVDKLQEEVLRLKYEALS